MAKKIVVVNVNYIKNRRMWYEKNNPADTDPYCMCTRGYTVNPSQTTQFFNAAATLR